MTTIFQRGNEFSDLPFSASQMERDLQKMQAPAPAIKPLPDAANPVPVNGKTAVAKDTPSAAGGGIASPLREGSITTRVYHAGKYFTSSDGLLVWPAVQTLKFTDAAGRAVQIDFGAPS